MIYHIHKLMLIFYLNNSIIARFATAIIKPYDFDKLYPKTTIINTVIDIVKQHISLR